MLDKEFEELILLILIFSVCLCINGYKGWAFLPFGGLFVTCVLGRHSEEYLCFLATESADVGIYLFIVADSWTSDICTSLFHSLDMFMFRNPLS